MKKTAIWSVVFLMISTVSFAQHDQTHVPIVGRWDITLERNGRQLPSWLEVIHSGTSSIVGYFVSTGGSARPISRVNVDGSKFSFAIPTQWEEGKDDLKMEGEVSSEGISGNITWPDGKIHPFKGKKAPVLRREKTPEWGTPIQLFNGKDLTGWQALGRTNQWTVVNGVLTSPKTGANIRTEKTFNDFKLQIEFRYPKGSNSGVYLRGRYEVQVSDNAGSLPTKGDYGAIYGFLPPSVMAAKPAGEWQKFEITLIGRMVTVVANGITIISNQEIPGITGGALDSNEGEPGPIMMQGDHGAIEYRNIVLTPAK